MTEVRIARDDERDACLAVRREVFIEGQSVPPELEVDGLDDASTHVIAYDGDRPVGTARLRMTPEGFAKAERVAVVESHRGRQVGHQLMHAVEQEARGRGFEELILSAQTAVVAFYEARGYEVFGPEFEEAGIPHRKMRLQLTERIAP